MPHGMRLDAAACGMGRPFRSCITDGPIVPGVRLDLISAASVRLALVVAGLVLIGWTWDIGPLKSVLPGFVSMNPMTAVAFVLAALSLSLQSSPDGALARTSSSTRRKAIARLAAGTVVAIGLLRLAAVAMGVDTGVDQWLFAGRLVGDNPLMPNRMAPNTAIGLVLLGVALATLDATTRRGRRPAELLSTAVFVVSLLALTGYAYRVPEFTGVANFIPMALPTAAVFASLAIGVFVARPDSGMMAVLTGPSLGGAMARRLLPSMVLALLLLGWLRLEGERQGLYGMELGVALYTLANIAIFAALVGWSASALHRAEVERDGVAAVRDQALALNRMIMDNSLDVICAIDADGRFVKVSMASAQLWGYAPAELVGRAYAELVHPDDAIKTTVAAEVIRSGQPTVDFSNRYVCKDGRVIDIDWSSVWSVTDGMWFSVARDATRRKQTERAIASLNAELALNAEQLQQSNHELEAFSYSISHDLRAPLRHIDGYARMLQEDAGDQLDAEMRRYLDTISDSARQMGALIDDLLAFSRLGRKAVECTEIDMQDLVGRVVHEVGAEERVSFGALPPAFADPVLLKQVWVNLLSNALKYSAPRGDGARIEISGEHGDGILRYRICDNGVGFDMRYVDKLFGVFQRLHSPDEFEGTGVGLAIVQRIVIRHGGTISAEAEPGRGAIFTFELPIIGGQDVPEQDIPAVSATEASA